MDQEMGELLQAIRSVVASQFRFRIEAYYPSGQAMCTPVVRPRLVSTFENRELQRAGYKKKLTGFIGKFFGN